ncbi:MAG: dihydroorotase [Rhodospirillaceae bacterium]
MNTLTIRRPDDWHVHFRDGAMMAAVVPLTARQMGRAIVMPNLVPPVTTAKLAAKYRDRILAAVPAGVDFTPLMTAYLTDDTNAADLAAGFKDGVLAAVKLYPAGATTNSASGVTDIEKTMPALEKMAEIGMPLLVHGEVTDSAVDIFDREAVFIEKVLIPLVDRLPGLKLVFEHITTADAAGYVQGAGPTIAATITAHHLVINRNDIFKGGIRPHMYCLPVAKRERHRLALRKAAVSGNAKFFLGTDTAPHAVHAKEAACGCAGIFSALAAIEVYAQVFDEEDALDQLEPFASLNGPAFYGLAPNDATVTLTREAWAVPDAIGVPGSKDTVKPFLGGETVRWRLRA